MTVKTTPDEFHTVTPYLTVTGVAALLDFVRDAFGAVERLRMGNPDGTVAHAQVLIGDSMVMMGECAGGGTPSPAYLYIYVPDCDATYRKALEAGGTSDSEPTDMFYGDRVASVKDAAGNTWWIAQHLEDVSEEELERRRQEMMQNHA